MQCCGSESGIGDGKIQILDLGWKIPDPGRIKILGPQHCTPHRKIVKITVTDPDPGSGAFLTPGSGIEKKSGPWIRDSQ
jgi:hypothetical protein